MLWSQTATDQLAGIWLSASDRQPVNDAVVAIDALLSSDPSGELTYALAEGLRTATILPLRAIYSVRDVDRVVDVATVRQVVG